MAVVEDLAGDASGALLTTIRHHRATTRHPINNFQHQAIFPLSQFAIKSKKGGSTMPGFDGTDPGGYGPGTGGSFGYCSPWICYGYRNEGRWSGSCGRGRHHGRYGGPSPGCYSPRINPWDFYPSKPALEEEKTYLKDLSRNLEMQLNEIKKRLDEISWKQAEETDRES